MADNTWGSGKRDLTTGWNDYQAGRTGASVREAFSMDDVWGKYADQQAPEDHGAKNRWLVDGLVNEGYVRDEDRSKAFDRLQQTGGNWYYDPDNKLMDFDQYDVSYDKENPAHRDAQRRASDLGHALPDSTELSRAGYQNVTQADRERLRDQGFGSYGASGGTGSFRPSGLSGMAGVGGSVGSSAVSGSGVTGRTDKANDLYSMLMGRAQQSLNIDPNDPIIKAQVDNYRAEQERAFRNVRSDAAESKNPLRPTQDRMAGERVAQSVASLQSELMARELTSRRGEIVGALSGMGGILTEDQQAGLQRELANLDNMIRQQQVNISGGELDLSRELGLGRLGLDTELGRGNLDLGIGRLGLDTELGRGQLSLDQLRNELLNRQFYADLNLRQQGLNSQNDQFAARLGFDTADRGSYWDWIRSGGTL